MMWLGLFSFIWGALIVGMARRMRARMQKRVGPPLWQGFYDMAKLVQKRTMIIHSTHALLGVFHLLLLYTAVVLLFSGAHILFVIFVHLLASVVLVIAGFSVPSIYSHLGAQRELLAIVAYEPIFILVAVGFYLVSGSFEVGHIMAHGHFFLSMPLLFIAFLFVVQLKSALSPFDMAGAHQEIVEGTHVEYGGLFYELLYVGKYLEYVFVYSFVFMFAGSSWLLGLGVVATVFIASQAVDTSTARLEPMQTVKLFVFFVLSLAVINIAGIVL